MAWSRGRFPTYSPGDFELPNSEVSISSSAEWVTEPTLEGLYGSLEGIGSEMMYPALVGIALPSLALEHKGNCPEQIRTSRVLQSQGAGQAGAD